MTTTTDNPRRILDLLAAGKITVDEAQDLLRAVETGRASQPASEASDAPARPSPRWIRIAVEKAGRDGRPPKQVTIRVPIAVVRGGARLGALFPAMAGDKAARQLREHGIDLAAIDFSQIERVLAEMGETTIDVDEGQARVRITCE